MKNYYCDYCFKSFKDANRKKHLNSFQHKYNRLSHYQQFEDCAIYLELCKEDCYNFKCFGKCPFGDQCFRSHFDRKVLLQRQKQLKYEEIAVEIQKIKDPQDWLENHIMNIDFRD